MPGAGLYTVGASGTYPQIQDAVDQLVTDQGVADFTATQTIRFVDDGLFESFTIPSTLSPTSDYKLVVEGLSGKKPIVSRTTASEAHGAKIETPHVVLDNFWVQGFLRSIHGIENRLTLSNLRLYDSLTTGILLEDVHNAYIANCVVQGYGYGIALLGSDDAVILHDTVRTLPGASRGRAAVYVRLSDDADARCYIYDSNLAAESGYCIAVTPKSASRLRSDYNNLYSAGKGVGRVVEADGVAFRTIADWRRRTGQDSSSISEVPFFYSTTAGSSTEKTYFDLRLRDGSPLAKRGIAVGSLTLPAHATAATVTLDLVGNTRRDPPAPGAFDVLPGLWEFPSPFPAAGESTPYGEDLDELVESAKTSYSALVDPWYPKLRSGNFFVREHGYHLFAGKEAQTLDGITWSFFDITNEYVPGSVTVVVDGADIDETSWRIRGTTLIVKHRGLDVDNLTSVMEVTGEVLTWNTGDLGFDSGTRSETGTFVTATRRYFLEPQPVQAAPVVVTDDLVTKIEDTGHLPYGFDVDWDADLSAAEVLFRQTNLLDNPDFSYLDGVVVRSFDVTNATPVATVTPIQDLPHPRMGRRFMLVANGGVTGEAVAGPGDFYAQCWVAPTGSVPQTVVLGVTSRDSLGVQIDNWETSQAISEFSRLQVAVPATGAVATYDVYVAATGTAAVEAVQFETGEVTNFNRMPDPDDLTFEWEGSANGVYTVSTLNVNPLTNPMTNGFLVLRNLPADQFVTTPPTGATTLSDWEWPAGRLTHLPYAKLTGKHKWQSILREDAAGTSETISVTDDIPIPYGARFFPSPLIVMQGSSGEPFSVEMADKDLNPWERESATMDLNHATSETGGFLGYLARKQYGFWTQLGRSISVKGDARGTVFAILIPPAPELFELSDPTVENDGTGYVVTPYPVSAINHGNIVVFDDTGNPVSLEGATATGEYAGSASGEYYRAVLPTYPTNEDVQVWADDLRLARTWGEPGRYEFYADLDQGHVVSRHATVTAWWTPRLVWRDPSDPHKIRLSAGLSLPSHYLVAYDGVANLRIQGTGQVSGSFTQTADVIYRHRHDTGEVGVA